MAPLKNSRNAEYTKEFNRKLFLRMLRMAPASRADLARGMGLTRAATSLIADELIREGWIEEREACGTCRGRTPIPLALCPDAAYAVGVYLNRTGCEAAIEDLAGNLIVREKIRLDSTDNMLFELAAAIAAMIEREKIPYEKILGAGISAPGPLDAERGIILNPPKFDLWHQTEICRNLEALLKMPVYLENNAACLARYHYGKEALHGSEDFLLLLVDSGVGSGVISGGKVLKSTGAFTCELGHVSIRFDGKPCPCGNTGCLEAYAAIPNLLQGTPYASWKQVIDDPAANQLWQQELEYLAAGVSTMANLISIDTVVLAGDLLYGVEKTAPLLEEKLNGRILRRFLQSIRVLPACSGPHVAVSSAAQIVFDQFLTV